MTTTARPAKVPRAAGRARTPASRTRAENRNLVRLLRQMVGAQAPAEAQGRVELPAWVVEKLGLEPGDLVEFVVTASVLAFCPPRLRSFNRGRLLPDRSVRLPAVVLDGAAPGPLAFVPLDGGTYRLCPARQAQQSAAGREPRLPAAVSAAGRLLMPAAVLSGLGVEPGDLIVFGPREDGTFEVQSLALLVERTAAALRDLVAGHGTEEERMERQVADARERALGDPLAGAWRPA